jgi:hypothetical protein
VPDGAAGCDPGAEGDHRAVDRAVGPNAQPDRPAAEPTCGLASGDSGRSGGSGGCSPDILDNLANTVSYMPSPSGMLGLQCEHGGADRGAKEFDPWRA